MVACALAIAVAGKFGGRIGAISAALILLVGVTLIYTRVDGRGHELGKLILSGLVLFGMAALSITVPMLVLTKEKWMPRRLIAGLMGALFATLALPFVSLFVACGILDDCL